MWSTSFVVPDSRSRSPSETGSVGGARSWSAMNATERKAMLLFLVLVHEVIHVKSSDDQASTRCVIEINTTFHPDTDSREDRDTEGDELKPIGAPLEHDPYHFFLPRYERTGRLIRRQDACHGNG